MTIKTYQKFLYKVKTSSPLVLCLTNTVTVNDCANALLAIGASPVMSEDPLDASSLAKLASALVINIGTINAASRATMEAAVDAALEAGQKRDIPVVLDPVGAGATPLRLSAAKHFARSAAVIKGNASEILALVDYKDVQKGVDSSTQADEDFIIAQAGALAKETKSVVAVTGPADLITNGEEVIKIGGGTPLLTKLTGIGCVLSAMVGAYVGASPKDPLKAVAAACIHMARAGEKAQEKLERPMSLGSFKVALYDEIALMEGSDLDCPRGKGQWLMDA